MPLPADDYLNAEGDNPKLRDFAEKWILDRDTGGGDKEVANMELSLLLGNGADAWLASILIIAKKTEDGRHDPYLAAGLLEDFLVKHGEVYIETVAELAQKSPRFHHLLGGVWKNAMKKGLWHRIEAIRGAPW